MTALEAFNALDNREVSRKEVEQVLTQAKAENNTAIIYRLSRVLNDSPEATHFEITITHYDSSVGLSGVQHTGDYREALDDCGRLRKGWKFVKGNVVKVEEKPKKEAKPKKEKAPQKEGKNIENTVTFLHTERFKDDLSYHALERSYSWISFDPEKRAKREQQDWADSMEELYNSHAEQAQQTGALEAYNAAFEKGYASLLKNYKEMISIRARTFSTAITGGAGITARKIANNESLMQREYEKLKIHNQEVKKLKNKLAKIAKNTPADQYETGEVVKSVDVNAIAKLQDKIKQLEEKKEYIYRQQKAEKEYKKSKDSSVFEKYDIKKEDVEQMLDEINRYGYALYSNPANINAEIRRIRERITGLEKNQNKGEEEILIEGGKIVKMTETELKERFPGVKHYLTLYKDELLSRDSDKSCKWFEYGRSQALQLVNKEKLLLSTIITNTVLVYSLKRQDLPYSGLIITKLSNSGLSLSIAKKILQSGDFLNYVRSIGVPLNGNSVRITSKDIENFTFREI